ncbi:penicillin-binding protein 2 [Helicobacter muridarum]|uniref:Penicillin-binding protein n=1 Tax=Helicobacter muridarum TaxID=216 RepID=A0A099U1X1_9HELI|nr:penicillin-binding protein 2 [Helicobacter muridarum]TLE00789.1 penicillin-binding protein 2 [Helicobacter muridarum]STQ86525.1 penicillin-binding protein [Helicobacter muridarum]
MKKIPLTFKILYIVFAITFFIILVKIYVLSVAKHQYYYKLSVDNTIKTEVIVPIRGQILDRNNEPLAINDLGFSLALKNRLKKEQYQEEINFIISYIADTNRDELIEKYERFNSHYRRTPVTLIEFIPYAQMQIIYAAMIQRNNIIITPTTRRFYPYNTSASHIIGYIGASDTRDREIEPISKYTKVIGKQGLEKQYNSFLQGKLGYRKIQVNNLNQRLRLIEEVQATSNNDINTSLDMRLQEKLDLVFQNLEGAAIIMDANNGEILAAGSYPEYNINDFIGGISHTKYQALLNNPYRPLINKLISGQYPPGSVTKMGMALSFLEFADITESTIIQTPPFIDINGHKFRDWKASGHGSADVYKAIRESVDVYFYKLSKVVGIDNMAAVMSKLGFGKKTGVDLPYENSGVFPTPEWKMRFHSQQWYIGDTITTSIGQGSFLSTPIQIARYTALLASGKMVTPHFVKELGGNPADIKVENVLSDFEKSKLPALRLGMYQVCSDPSGTAYRTTRGAKVKLACKTGTAQIVKISQDTVKRKKELDMDYWHRSQSWITAFLPYDKPQYVITILIEHGGSGGRGGPLLVQLANEMQRLGYVK